MTVFNQGDKVNVNLTAGTFSGTVINSLDNDRIIHIKLDNGGPAVTLDPWDVFLAEETE